jgi:spermidine synthase
MTKSLKKQLSHRKLSRSSWVYLLFFFSGISGLIYQIVWTRMLTLVFGHTIYSVSIVLSAFMAGLGLGSYLWGTTIDKVDQPLLIYGKIEILIGLLAAVLSIVFSSFSPVYIWIHHLLPDFFFHAGTVKTVLAFSLMLIPTVMMGATLPIMCKYFVTDETNLGRNISYLYALNTFGAAVGCLVAGYFLIGHLGVLETTFIAAALNIFIGVTCIFIFKKGEPNFTCGLSLPKPKLVIFQFDRKNIGWIAVSFLCGFTALGYEVVWTRLLVFSIGSTVYSFSLMLTIFLFGITVGGLLIAPLFQRNIDDRLLLGLLQLGIGFYLIFSLYQSNWLLSSFIRTFGWGNAINEILIDFRNASALMLLPTILFGMSFPLLTRITAKGFQHIGSSLGMIYAMNTLGGVLGSIVAGYFFLPSFGSQQTLTWLAMTNILVGIFIFLRSSQFTENLRKVVATALSSLLLLCLLKMPDDLLQGFFMRNSQGKKNPEKLIYLNEGLTTTLAVFNDDDKNAGFKRKSLVLNGVNMSATSLGARQYMTLLSYIPLLLVEDPKNVLVICFGVGTTAGVAGVYPEINLVDSVDISPEVFQSGMLFKDTNYNVISNPKVNKITQDGRSHLLTTSNSYDVITAEPPPPRSAGSVNLYTREYYELTKRALKPGGIVSQWIPLHSQAETHIYEHFRTFLESFPFAMAWYPTKKEMILIGSNSPLDINLDQIEERFKNPVIHKIMHDIGYETPFSFLGNIWFLKKELKRLASDQNVITDNYPSLEFYLNIPSQISTDGIKKIIENRTPFEDVWEKISPSSNNLLKAERDAFENKWDQRLNLENAIDHYNLGNNLMHENKTEEAISEYREAVKLNPDFIMAHNNLGFALNKTQKTEESASHYRMAIKLKPEFFPAYLNLGNLMLVNRRVEEAIINYRTAIQLKPDYVEAHNGLGNAYSMTRNTKKSISHYQEAIQFNPNDPSTHNNLGSALMMKGMVSEAISHYKKAIQLKPGLTAAKNNLKKALLRLKKEE